jgi:trimeric autotransporter adhesin
MKKIHALGGCIVLVSATMFTSDVFALTCNFVSVSGCSNSVTANDATVGGGQGNVASAFAATVAGGWLNTASGPVATVAGGQSNSVSGNSSAVAGGNSNSVVGDSATIGGGLVNVVYANQNYAFVGGGHGNHVGVSGGTSTGASSAIVGGEGNVISDGAQQAFIGGGYQNTANGLYSVIGGGYGNAASAYGGATLSGYNNNASGSWAAILGGIYNVASGTESTALGGYCTASGTLSLAAGYKATAGYDGCVVFSDFSTGASDGVSCSAANQFVAKASGGVYFYTNHAHTSGAYLPSGSGSWSTLSDRNQKNGFRDVNTREVLERLVSIPVTTWSYNDESSGAVHMGPMAQDFYEKFSLGDSDDHISVVDADGVQVGAIQGLYSMVQEQEAEIQGVHAENEKLRKEMGDLEARLARLEAAAARR